MKRICDILTRNKTAVVVEDGVSYKQVTIRTNYKGVVLRGTQDGSTILTKNQFIVSAGQFILSRIDARNGAFGIIPEELEGAIITNDFLAFDINEDEVEREFFNVFLQSPVFLEACIKASRGNTNRKRVDEDFFLNYEVNLPPLSDQHDLIKQINEGRSKLALAQHEITHQQAILAKLKQAILQEAIQGKLTADWRAAHPDVEPASQLLHRIQAEKARLIAAKKLRPEKPLPQITPAEIPFEIPKGWEWCRASNIGFVIGGLTKNAVKRGGHTRMLPYLRVANVYANRLDLSDLQEIGVTDSEVEKLLLEKDDLLVVEGNGSRDQVGRIARWDGSVDPCVHQNHVIKVRLGEPKVAPWALYWFLSPSGRVLIEEQARTSTGLYNLSTGKVANLPIPLPPLAEQAAIVERVEALMTTFRALEAEIEQSRTHAAHLLQAVLKEAFAPASA
jgi:type I restriction enzyme, S subunit